MRSGPFRGVAVLAALGMLAGCITPVEKYYGFDPDPHYRNPGVFPGNYTYGGSSTVLHGGLLQAGKPEVIRLRSTLNAYAEPAGSTVSDGQVDIVMALWRPMNYSEQMPVIVDAGPYFELSTCVAYDLVYVGPVVVPPGLVPYAGQGKCIKWNNGTIDTADQRTPFLLKNFLPRGYAVAQIAVRGTGTAGGCMDLMGPAEVHDLDQAITWLGTQPWSNGNVAMIGASYDGSTPWEVASTGNVHLKTIVPVSGLPDIYDLMFHNGSAETRGPVMHDRVYWPYGFDANFPQQVQWPPESPVALPVPVSLPGKPQVGQAAGRQSYQDMQNLLCPDVYEGAAVAQVSTDVGGRGNEASNYWTVRDHRADVLKNYKGSIFLVHGLQDWNVDPHAAIPFNAQLRAAGIRMKEWYGQWAHAFPDSVCRASTPNWVSLPCRLDFAEVLGRWFDHELKGKTDMDLGPSIQIQTNIGSWRNADSFPPAAPNWTELHLTADNRLASDGGPEATVTLNPPQGGPAQVVELKSEPLSKDLRFSGLPQLRLPFATKGSGGMLAAWLLDEDANGEMRAPYAGRSVVTKQWRPFGVPVVAHAQLNLMYYNGGEDRQPPVPAQRSIAKIEFEPLDVFIPQGHRLVLWVFQWEYPDHQATTTEAPVDIYVGGKDAILRLPEIQVDATDIFPVPGVHFPIRDLAEKMDIRMPALPTSVVGAAMDGDVTGIVAASSRALSDEVPAAEPVLSFASETAGALACNGCPP